MSKEFSDTAEPKVWQAETAGGLVNESVIAGGGTSVESLESLPVFYLGKDDTLAEGLAPLLARRGVFFTRIESAEVFAASGQTLPPCLLLLETALVPKSQTIAKVRDTLAAGNAMQIRLVCLAHSSDLALRLQALRAGAKAFLPLPVDSASVANKLLEFSRVHRSDQPRVLIVDDEAVAALFAVRVLQGAGMETRSVIDPLLVMDALEGFQPDLILMDLYMPAASGVELATIIREHESFHAIPIVFLSGERDADKQRAALRVGGDEFLAKPVSPKSLVAAVEHRIQLFRSTHGKEGDAGCRDRVTGLFNRRHFLYRIERALSSPDTKLRDAAVLCVAVDRSEVIVARAGVNALGAILEQVADALLQSVGHRVCVARTGEASMGLLIAPGAGGAAESLARDLVDRVAAARICLEPAGEPISVSVGVGPLAPSSDDALTSLLRAERICAAASKAGGRQVKVAVSRSVSGGGERVLRLLRQALKSGGFLLLFQPVVSLHGGNREYYDVQLRLKMGPEELIPPAEFLPVAELAGLMPEIDRWVMDHVLDVLQAHRADGRSLNLFVHQKMETLTDLTYLKWLGGEFVSRMLGDQRPIMQFYQTDLIDHLHVTGKRFPTIDRLGVPICVCDFEDEPGALKAVEKLPIALVRSTAETVARIGIGRMKESVAALHALNVRIVAEGIDDVQDIGRAWDCGVDFIQGNFIQPPQESLNFDFSASAVKNPA